MLLEPIDLMQFRPAPDWLADIRKTILTYAQRSTVVHGAQAGNMACVRVYWLAIWKFVDLFPKMVMATLEELEAAGILTGEQIRDGRKILKAMFGEEGWHRDLWWQAAEDVDLTWRMMEAFNRPSMPEVDRLILAVGGEPNLCIRMLNFAAVEQTATVVGTYMPTPAFNALHGSTQRSVPWCKVHQNLNIPYGETHESICYWLAVQAARTLGMPDLTPEFCERHILHVVQLFAACGEAGYERYLERQEAAVPA